MTSSYILVLRLDRDHFLEVGSLGLLRFDRGWYAYVGSGGRSPHSRVSRHLRREKRMRWHIDRLSTVCDDAFALLWLEGREECTLCDLLQDIGAEQSHRHFGSSDCRCRSHLYRLDAESLASLSDQACDEVMTRERHG